MKAEKRPKKFKQVAARVGDKHVVCAFAETAAGPGWANRPIWVILRDRNGDLSQECIQPDQQTHAMALLFKASNAMHVEMTHAVRAALAAEQEEAPATPGEED